MTQSCGWLSPFLADRLRRGGCIRMHPGGQWEMLDLEVTALPYSRYQLTLVHSLVGVGVTTSGASTCQL
jgi:hypothetical protein